MEQIGTQDRHDTVVAIVIGEDTSDFVLIKSERTGLWRFPGDRIRGEDIDPNSPHDRVKAADNAIQRIIRERAGLTIQKRRLIMMQRSIGTFYGYAGLADFNTFAPKDGGKNVQIFPFGKITSLCMPPVQMTTFDTVVKWIRE